MAMFTQNFGAEKAEAMLARVRASAKEDGLDFVPGQKAGNTSEAHRLLVWARSLGKEPELIEKIYSAYNCEAKWVGDREVLAQIAGQVPGLGEDAARAFLSDERNGVEELQRGLRRAQELGISGVPTMLVNGQQLQSGAHDVGSLTRLLRKVASE